LQRSDGAFQLVLWGEWLTGEDRMTISFDATHANVNIFDPAIGVEPVKTLSSFGSLKIAVSDHPIIVIAKADK
jgi:hypothetical protein